MFSVMFGCNIVYPVSGSITGAGGMICQSIPFPKAFWERLSDSHSQKAYGNAVVISSSVFA